MAGSTGSFLAWREVTISTALRTGSRCYSFHWLREKVGQLSDLLKITQSVAHLGFGATSGAFLVSPVLLRARL